MNNLRRGRITTASAALTEAIHYHELMKFRSSVECEQTCNSRLMAGLLMLALAGLGLAPKSAVAAQPGLSAPHKAGLKHSLAPPTSIAELTYLVLLGELQLQAGDAGTGYSLLLESAKKSGDASLFRRAINVALESRSGDAALDAARIWADSDPNAAEPLKLIIQVTLAMNRVSESGPTLGLLLQRAPDAELNDLITAVGQTYARVNDPAGTESTLIKYLKPWIDNPLTSSAVWTALGRVQAAAGQTQKAEASTRLALSSKTPHVAAALLAIELMESGTTDLEPLVISYIRGHANESVVPLAYTRFLLRADRYRDANTELATLTQKLPDAPEPWLMLGALAQQNGKVAEAESHFRRYLSLSDKLAVDQKRRGDLQARLSLAQISEAQNKLAEAQNWLDQIEDDSEILRVQLRKASLLARQGKLKEARNLIQSASESDPTDARTKLVAEVQLLKDAKLYGDAYGLLESATNKTPDDVDLLYEQAMLAEKMGRFIDMERQLRKVIALKPDHHHAFNALGYSMAERNDRLPEAKNLIVQALAMAPGDPFITDSLGWVEYRLGNLAEAARLLRMAYENKPDVEIGAHLGEVLWNINDKAGALKVLRESALLQGDNEVLKDTVRRLGISL